MATVRISERLLGEVRSTIERMKLKAIDAEAGQPPEQLKTTSMSDAAQEMLLRLVWGDNYDAWHNMPVEYRVSSDVVRLGIRYEDEAGNQRTNSMDVTCCLGKAFPPGFSYYNRISVPCTHPLVSDYHNASMRYEESVKRVGEEYDTIKTQVFKLLQAYSTLNTAAKAWPAIRAFIPKEYLATLDRKVERGKASKVEVEGVDMDMLAVAAASARMGGQ